LHLARTVFRRDGLTLMFTRCRVHPDVGPHSSGFLNPCSGMILAIPFSWRKKKSGAEWLAAGMALLAR
jgi:hypothetical protein